MAQIQDPQKEDWLVKLPNQLTLFRIAVVPFLLLLFSLNVTLEIRLLDYFCALLFALAGFTDWLDGYLARKFQLESKIGAIMDPIADKLLVGCGLVLLVGGQRIGIWMAGLLICRELAISGLRLIALQQNLVIQVHPIGKFKTLFLDVSIVCMMVNYPLWGWPFKEVGMIATWLALVTSMYSAWVYTYFFMKSIKL